ncbi:unnamed protein product [Triticum turgidum subsp. durum]|uniref:Uncharacterized protein n=1 Tax=Triticum turgidum subsp. durum TaxID=4567 RepID=A0A9R1BTW0_TRITD|nr:unnamed protein product [Triticum turgidum subsp. durum]
MNKKELLVLDTRTMEFSIADFPPGAWLQLQVAIVDAGEGRVGMFSTQDGNVCYESILCYMVRQNKGESSGQWDMKTISVGYGYRHYIRAATENYLILLRMDAQWPDVTLLVPQSKMDFFSFDVKTMQLERMFAEHNQRSAVHIYTNFPPSLLSSPTV